MKPRPRPIKGLYFRWGIELDRDSQYIAMALESAGLITIDGQMYTETQTMREIPKPEFEETIKNLILRGAK